MKKKILTCMIAFVMTVVMTFGLAGCSEGYLPEYENEYFRYAVRTNKDGTKEGYLIGFTELGAEQTHLILPQEIDGIPIVGLSYERILGYGTQKVGDFISDKLKKLFVLINTDKVDWKYFDCSGILEQCELICWKSDRIGLFFCNRFVLGFNEYLKLYHGNRFDGYSYKSYLANISYMYNYEGAEDGGYYWVDSYDNSTVEFIPPEPTREGYEFGGWYKEPECENAWDFATDRTGSELKIEDTYIPYLWNKTPEEIASQYSKDDGVKLYAKWKEV